MVRRQWKNTEAGGQGGSLKVWQQWKNTEAGSQGGSQNELFGHP